MAQTPAVLESRLASGEVGDEGERGHAGEEKGKKRD